MGLRSRFMLGVSVLLASWGALGADTQMPTDRLIIKFKDTLPALERAHPRALQRLAQLGVAARMGRRLPNGAYVVAMSESRRQNGWLDVMHQLSFESDIAYVEPDLKMMPDADPYFDYQWYLNYPNRGVNAERAWNYSTGLGAVVAVLDTGILPHPDLLANTLPGYDFISDSFTANDGGGRDNNAADPGDGVTAGACGGGQPEEDRKSTWHGTHVAGIAVAPMNGIGVVGVAHEAKVLPLRVLGRCGGYTSDIVDAIYWAAGYSVAGVADNSTPVDAINLSLSSSATGACGQAYSDAITAAVNAGVTVVTSAGNKTANAADYAPGNCAGVINVAAVDRYGYQAPYTNTGAVVDVAAAGGRIVAGDIISGVWSTLNAGQFAPGEHNYVAYQGTSMAAPQVAATVALMRSVAPDATPEAMEVAIKDTAADFTSPCVGCGSGRLDAEEAVRRVLGLTVPNAVADLKVVLQGDNGKFIDAGDGTGTIQYKVIVTNNGPDLASDLTVSNIFPSQVTLDYLQPAVGAICNISTYACSWAEQPAGESRTFTIRVRTSNEDKMDFAAAIDGADSDPNTADNYSTKKFGGGMAELLLLLPALLWRRR
ncbi:MAG: S8 family serine peptidase [Pseudomonadota bacterium]|nr:S8 family serine peptidase [Pseudomonadota bacterium]